MGGATGCGYQAEQAGMNGSEGRAGLQRTTHTQRVLTHGADRLPTSFSADISNSSSSLMRCSLSGSSGRRGCWKKHVGGQGGPKARVRRKGETPDLLTCASNRPFAQFQLSTVQRGS